MEFDFVALEELSSKFQSKSDLYLMLNYKYKINLCNVKGQYVLPSYNAFLHEFIRQFFSWKSVSSFDYELCYSFWNRQVKMIRLT